MNYWVIPQASNYVKYIAMYIDNFWTLERDFFKTEKNNLQSLTD